MHSLSYSTVLSFHIGGRKNRSNNIICTTGLNEGTIATELKKKRRKETTERTESLCEPL